MLSSNLSDNILYLVFFAYLMAEYLQIIKIKNGRQNHIFSIFLLHNNVNFRFLHDLELINLSVMFFEKKITYI